MKVSAVLAEIIAASRPRSLALATGHIRERIAVSIRASRPTYFRWEPSEYYTIYLRESDDQRRMYEEWADRLLMCFDQFGVEIVDTREDSALTPASDPQP